VVARGSARTCVPDLELYGCVIEANGLCEEGGADRALLIVEELALDESKHLRNRIMIVPNRRGIASSTSVHPRERERERERESCSCRGALARHWHPYQRRLADGRLAQQHQLELEDLGTSSGAHVGEHGSDVRRGRECA